MSLNNCLSKCF